MDALPSQSRRQLRPRVEGLESLQLLSGMAHAVAVHPVAQVHAEATRTPVPVAAVNLHGTIHATAHVSETSIVIAGSGNLGSVGTASINERSTANYTPANLTLSTKKGQLTLGGGATLLTGGAPGTFIASNTLQEVPIHYSVISGTGAYAHTTGSGTILTTITLGKNDKITLSLKFT